jgi:hypothetical protein
MHHAGDQHLGGVSFARLAFNRRRSARTRFKTFDGRFSRMFFSFALSFSDS